VVTHYTNACISYPSNIVTAILDVTEIEDKEKIVVYPNPTVSELIIESKELKIEKVEFHDIEGKVILTNHLFISSSKQILDISNLNSGIYFVKILTTQGEIVKKVVKL
jgi:hypothetical protein